MRDVAVVAGGTAVAQAITLAAAPLITRLYEPAAFGAQGIFLSLAGTLAAVAALTYPIAIVLPQSDSEARGLARLSIIVGFGIAVIVAILISLFGKDLLVLMNADVIGRFMYLLPLFMMLSTCSAVLGQWMIRKKAFRLTATLNVWNALIVNATKVGAGFCMPTAGTLIATSTFGNMVQPILVFASSRWRGSLNSRDSESSDTSTMAVLARRYSDFPLLRAPQLLINAMSQSMPIIMLSIFYGPASAGFYALANSVLNVPAGLLGTSVTQVFYPRANEAHQRGERIDGMIIKATLGMAAIGLVPFLLLIVFGPFLFRVAFGETWTLAGTYAQWLAVFFFMGFINKPAVWAVPILNRQKELFAYEIFSAGAKVASLALGYFVLGSEIAAIALFAISGAAAYLLLIFGSIVLARAETSARI